MISKLKPDKNGNVIIYRGVGSESASIEKSYSWTLDINTAMFFATRFSKKSTIYKATIKIDNVIEYINGRNEKEVLVLPENLNNISKFNLIGIDNIEMDWEEIIEEYHSYCEDIRPEYFHNPKGIHGLLHAKHVLFLCLVLSRLHDLNYEDFNILCTCAIYHDIGRTHDMFCLKHGNDSFKKMLKLNLINNDYYDYENEEIIHYIINNHCINDKIAFKRIKKYNIKDKNRAIKLLKIFKDADDLDRVRLGDLDVKYLRFNNSKKLVLLAQQLLKGVE
ncbi:MAG: HD domain-containing protein [archaeon]